MKKLIGSDIGAYSFNPTLGTITITGLPINLVDSQILMIIDTTPTLPVMLFNFLTSQASVVGNVITLPSSLTSSLNSADILQIYVDIPVDSIPLLSATYNTLNQLASMNIDYGPIDTSGTNSIVLQIAGVWQGSLMLFGANDGSTWEPLLVNELNSLYPQDLISQNGIYSFKTITKYVAIAIVTLNSGAINLTMIGRDSEAFVSSDNLGLALDPNTGVSLSTNIQNLNRDLNNALVLSDAPTPIVIANIVNGVTIIDTTGYSSLHLTVATGFVANLSSSNDGINWPVYNGGYSLAGIASLPQSSIAAATANGWIIPCAAKFIKLTVSAIGATKSTGYLRNNTNIGPYATSSFSLDRIASNVVASAGLNGVMPVGGESAIGSAPGAAYPHIIAGVDNSLTSGGIANPLVRRLLMDTAGRPSVGLFALDPNNTVRNLGTILSGIQTANNPSLAVQDVSSFEGLSIPELLVQILTELKILTFYTYNSQTQPMDEPSAFRNDPFFSKE